MNIDKEGFKIAITEYLDCPCQFFDPTDNENDFIPSLENARGRRLSNGFTPILIGMKRAYQLEIWNNELQFDWNNELFTKKKTEVVERKNNLLSQKYESNILVKKELDMMYQDNLETLNASEKYYMEKRIKQPLEYDSFIGYWNTITRNPCKTYPLILAEIPTKKPYEIFAWLPFVGGNYNPMSDEIMRMMKYFYEVYQLEPAVVMDDTIECVTTRKFTIDEAKQLAKDMCGWNLGTIELYGTEERLVESLLKDNKAWFWWD